MRKTYPLLTLLFLFSPVFIQAQSVQFLDEMRVRLQNAKGYTLRVAEAMPEEAYGFKPVADEMSFSEQLLHSAQNITWLTSSYLTEKPAPFPEDSLMAKGKSKREVEQIVEKAFDYAINVVKDWEPAQLEKSVKFFAGPLSKRQIMLLIADHQTHHRAQLIVYLRIKGIKPPAYVGW